MAKRPMRLRSMRLKTPSGRDSRRWHGTMPPVGLGGRHPAGIRPHDWGSGGAGEPSGLESVVRL